jgi:hypothetical protein
MVRVGEADAGETHRVGSGDVDGVVIDEEAAAGGYRKSLENVGEGLRLSLEPSQLVGEEGMLEELEERMDGSDVRDPFLCVIGEEYKLVVGCQGSHEIRHAFDLVAEVAPDH